MQRNFSSEWSFEKNLVGKICFNLQNSSFLSSTSLRFATQIQQKKRTYPDERHNSSIAEPNNIPWSTRTPLFHSTAVTLPVLRKLCHSRIQLLSPHLSHQKKKNCVILSTKQEKVMEMFSPVLYGIGCAGRSCFFFFLKSATVITVCLHREPLRDI